MISTTLSIQQLWDLSGFRPNAEQEAAILHVDGPVYLTAGPGSGKTRVLLWRTLNLIVFHGVEPEEIYLSTFTEKAAAQLQEGLRVLLGSVTNITGRPFDIASMYVGTVHSLCRRLITDRRFRSQRRRAHAPVLMDALAQYFHVYRPRIWEDLVSAAGFADANEELKQIFEGYSRAKHAGVSNCIALFNRLSEECIEPEDLHMVAEDPDMRRLALMYARYRASLHPQIGTERTDFALLQQEALEALESDDRASYVFKHVIIDEYQDTNTIQERLFFRMAAGHKNICVVGDDDQALYRFRGATVENFVQFPQRCQKYLGVRPTRISLETNYRSRKSIVDFYNRFISHCDWHDGASGQSYRVGKIVRAHRQDEHPAVVASTPAEPDQVFIQIAELVRALIDTGKVADPNQVAFLFPSLKSVQVERMMEALRANGLSVYAPRAGKFLNVEESLAVFGVFVQVFGKPACGNFGGDYAAFCEWLDAVDVLGAKLVGEDAALRHFVAERRAELKRILSDYNALIATAAQHSWNLEAAYDINRMKRALIAAPGLSDHARRLLASAAFEYIATLRARQGNPFTLDYIINRATALDWNVLDLFYRICGFDHFKRMFDLAEQGIDEGPICNLSLISQYLARFVDDRVAVIRGGLLERFNQIFFMSYLYALFRLGESEYEYAEDPFPKGRIPFLTIHQAKGLEFPVVVLPNPSKRNRGPQVIERLVHPILQRDQGEPLDRMAEFDIMRMFYVALSRAKNLLVIGHLKGRGQHINEPFKRMLDHEFPRIPDLDINTVPAAKDTDEDLPRSYSFTGDYLQYKKCPRQYMIFNKYGFAASRSQTMFFGSLVHQTLEDLHQYLISKRDSGNGSRG